MGKDPNQRGGSRKWIVAAVEASLRRLGTDYIDLYQLHRPDYETELGQTLAALTDLVRAGKIRAFGSSMFPAELMTQAQWAAERQGWALQIRRVSGVAQAPDVVYCRPAGFGPPA